MKRETIEKHLFNNARQDVCSDVASAVIDMLNRENERLTEELAELDAKKLTPECAPFPGFTDSDGQRWDFVKLSNGMYAAVVVRASGNATAYGESETFGEPGEALMKWKKESGL